MLRFCSEEDDDDEDGMKGVTHVRYIYAGVSRATERARRRRDAPVEPQIKKVKMHRPTYALSADLHALHEYTYIRNRISCSMGMALGKIGL